MGSGCTFKAPLAAETISQVTFRRFFLISFTISYDDGFSQPLSQANDRFFWGVEQFLSQYDESTLSRVMNRTLPVVFLGVPVPSRGGWFCVTNEFLVG